MCNEVDHGPPIEKDVVLAASSEILIYTNVLLGRAEQFVVLVRSDCSLLDDEPWPIHKR